MRRVRTNGRRRSGMKGDTDELSPGRCLPNAMIREICRQVLRCCLPTFRPGASAVDVLDPPAKPPGLASLVDRR